MPKKNEFPEEVRLDFISPLLGITTRRYRDLAKEGRVSKVLNSKVVFKESIKTFCDYQRDLARGSGKIKLTDERARLTKAQANLKELQVELLKGDIIEADIAIQAWSLVLFFLKNSLLSLGTKLAASLQATETREEKKKIIDDKIRTILDELSKPDLRKLGRLASSKKIASDAETSTTSNMQSVGRQRTSSKPRKQRRGRKLGDKKS